MDGSGNGSPDQEGDDHGCVPVMGSSFNESITTTVMYSGAQVLAFCTWGCVHYNNATTVYDQDDMKTVVVNPCINGCNGRVDNDTSPPALMSPTCVDICDQENECSDEDKITNNIRCQSCLIGCEDVYENIFFNETASANANNIQKESLQISSSHSLPEIHIFNPSLVNPTVIVISLHDIETFRNYYIVKQLNYGENIIEVDYFSCKEILLSYAHVNQFGISRFSPDKELVVSGVSPIEPAILMNDDVFYSTDNRPSYLGHFTMQLTWSYPSSGLRSVQYFIIILEGIEIRQNECKPENFTISPYTQPQYDANETLISYNVTATQPSGPPVSDCIYTVKIQTIPKYAKQLSPRISDTEYVKVPHYHLPKGTMYCMRRLRADGTSYDILIDIALDDYIAEEQVADSIDIIPKLITYSEDFSKIIDNDAYAIIKKYVQYADNATGTNLKHWLSDQHYEPKSSPTMIYQFSVYVYWKAELLFTPTVQAYVCNISALSPLPETTKFITSNNSSLIAATRLSPTEVMIDQPLQWTEPTMNGQFNKYQLCVVDSELHHNQDPTIPSLQCHEIHLINQTFLPLRSIWSVFTDANCLYIQIRSYNAYVSSNWSSPLPVSVDDHCQYSSIIPTYSITTSINIVSSTRSSVVNSVWSSQSPISVSSMPANSTSYSSAIDKPLIGATAAGMSFLIISVIIITGIMTLHWILRRRKRRLEFVEEATDVMFQMGPRIQLTFAMEYDEWEVSPSQIIIDSALGHGAFGEVYKGIIEESPTNNAKCGKKSFHKDFVAIKLLKASATGDERSDFLKEIDIMKKISNGNSPHVVNMVGCVTSQEPLSLITEFIKHGDLLTYLRINRKSIGITTEEKDLYSDLNELNAMDLVAFGYQIAAGMEYLSSIGIVHRDLACRNVLIGEGKSLKITDFGMSRLIGDQEDDAYIKTTKGRLPLKWMAIESIIDRQFTVLSDVWSYGVTLWEIATLGGFPYPTIANDKLLHQLKNGYRMERPSNCSKEVYNVMMDCWAANPKSRPKFSTLRKLFDQMLTAQNADSYIDLQTDESNLIYDAAHSNDGSSCSDIRMTLSPGKKGSNKSSSMGINGAGCGSKGSIDTTRSNRDRLKVTNPWERSSSTRDLPDIFGQLNRASSNCSTPLASVEGGSDVDNTRRPRSVMLWPQANDSSSPSHRRKENLYVDEPSQPANIKVVVSTPSSPYKSIN